MQRGRPWLKNIIIIVFRIIFRGNTILNRIFCRMIFLGIFFWGTTIHIRIFIWRFTFSLGFPDFSFFSISLVSSSEMSLEETQSSSEYSSSEISAEWSLLEFFLRNHNRHHFSFEDSLFVWEAIRWDRISKIEIFWGVWCICVMTLWYSVVISTV